MRPFPALCAAALLAGCATDGVSPSASLPPARKFSVALAGDIYQFRIPVDLDHDTKSCAPAVRLRSNELPPQYRFVFYPCAGPAFRAMMSGPKGPVAKAETAGLLWQIYLHEPVTFGGTPLGYIVVTVPPAPPPVVYRPAS